MADEVSHSDEAIKHTRKAATGRTPAARHEKGGTLMETPPAKENAKAPVELLVNGRRYLLELEPRRILAEVLRGELHLTGTKIGCGMGDCGACTVIIDGKAVYSCLTLALECAGRDIITIEGLSSGGALDPVQEAFIANDAFQCGFCTPGQVMAARALLMRNPSPSADEIRRGMAGNICRCSSYPAIVSAVLDAAKKMKAGKDAP
jgi:aerobic-type carbon monoxide dehydrogenase small subunit (CoxS/CutS family)